jgi:hypothetical protein
VAALGFGQQLHGGDEGAVGLREPGRRSGGVRYGWLWGYEGKARGRGESERDVLSQYYDKKSQLIAGVFKYLSIRLKICSFIHLPTAYISR